MAPANGRKSEANMKAGVFLQPAGGDLELYMNLWETPSSFFFCDFTCGCCTFSLYHCDSQEGGLSRIC